MRHKGLCSFVVFLTEEMYPFFVMEQQKYAQFTDVTRHYKVTSEKSKKDYHFVLLDVMDYQRSNTEICKFVLNSFTYTALHQEDSLYIFVEDEMEFREALIDLYKDKEHGKYFFYDMLSIAERYVSLLDAEPSLDAKDDLQIIHYDSVNGHTYQLNLGAYTVSLFQEETEVDVINNMTGEIYNIDILEGLDVFTFKIAILGDKKLEKRH